MPNLTIERCTTLNPSTLIPIATDGCPHDCVAETEKVVLPRPDLTDLPLPDAEITMFVDGSSRKNPDRSNATGYAVVTLTEVLEAEALPKNYSAQQAEIVALARACGLGKGKCITIHTDSAYAFNTVHVFAAQWRNRGMVTTAGKPITHAQLILNLLEAVLLPKKIAICKCEAHTKGMDSVSIGNRRADEEAKRAGGKPHSHTDSHLKEEVNIDTEILRESQLRAPIKEIARWVKMGAVDKGGI